MITDRWPRRFKLEMVERGQAMAQRPSTGAMHMLPEAVVVRAAVQRGRRER